MSGTRSKVEKINGVAYTGLLYFLIQTHLRRYTTL